MGKEKVTLKDIKIFLDLMTENQLEQTPVWWGDERGGSVKRISLLEEDYLDYGEGYEPLSCFTEELLEEYGKPKNKLSKGSIIFEVD